MLDVVILTCGLRGSASIQLEKLIEAQNVRVKAVIYSQGEVKNKAKYARRKAEKIIQIGPLGALAGLKMRKWFSLGVHKYIEVPSIQDVCEKYGISFLTTPTINCEQTITYFKDVRAQLGLSLGNGYIGRKVYSIPTYGMYNIHLEVLPAYQNAQSVIWQLFNMSDTTGYTIHKIDEHIDTGDIVYSETLPIIFKDTLAETVSSTYASLWQASAEGLKKVLDDFHQYNSNSQPQGVGKSYTTPSLTQFRQIRRNHKLLKEGQSEAKINVDGAKNSK